MDSNPPFNHVLVIHRGNFTYLGLSAPLFLLQIMGAHSLAQQ